MAKKWYALRVVSGQESKVSRLIENGVEEEDLPSFIGKVHIPMHEIPVVRAGKQYTQRKRLIPGYVLLEIDMPSGWKDVVTEIRGITGVIGFASVTRAGQRPEALSEKEVRHMLNYGKEGFRGSALEIAERFSEGEIVRIKTGPFKSFRGKIENIDAKRGTLRILVEIFGRVTPIDLDYHEVEKN